MLLAPPADFSFAMAVITLTSDYGLIDPYLPALKGALLSQAEGQQVVDISHGIEPGNFLEASFILRNSYSSFPRGSVHLIAFGEVSANRRLLAAEMDGHYFLLADNGLLSMINPELKISRIIEIDLRQDVSLFPSRDILARAAVFLAQGGKMDMLGREVRDVEQKTLIRPRIATDKSSILGSVVYIDNYGNLMTNITRKIFREVGKERHFTVMLPRNQRISHISQHYHEVAAGNVLALFNSQDLLEIGLSGARGKVFNGANTLLGVEVQNTVTVNFK